MATNKIIVVLEVQGYVQVVDSGYMGMEAKVQEHIAKARTDVQNWQWMVKKGALDSEPVTMKMTVKEVRIVVSEDSI